MRPFRNATTRVVALHLVLVAVSTALVLGFVWWRTAGVIDREMREVVQTELRTLADDYAMGGITALSVAISRRLEPVEGRDAVYLLTDRHGNRIVGNLAQWPPTVTPGGDWRQLELYRLDQRDPRRISAASVRLPGGARLLVGRDVQARAAFDRTLVEALGWAAAAMAVLALATGWLLSRLVLGRIDEVSATARGIVEGTLDRRMPVRGTGDEFDRLATTLNAMLDRIAGLVHDLRTVTDSVAHDLRSPLTRLMAELEEAAAGEDAPEARRARLDRARSEAERLLATLTALLDVARAEAGIGAEQFDEIDLAGLVTGAAELYAPLAEERGVTVETGVEPGLSVAGHPQLLAQAMSNLLENALRYAPAGSVIRVEARREGSHSVVAVADRGPGVPEAERSRVLGRFVRLDPSRGSPGAGLGLALVDAVARMHRATLRLADNAPGLRVEIAFA